MSRPYLASTFFNEVPANLEFWQKWQSHAEWNEGFVPLYEWDGVLFVGLIPDSQAPQINGSVVFVEAHSEALSQYYASYKTQSKPLKIPAQKIELTADGAPADPFAILTGDAAPSVEIVLDESMSDGAPAGLDVLDLDLTNPGQKPIPGAFDLPEALQAEEPAPAAKAPATPPPAVATAKPSSPKPTAPPVVAATPTPAPSAAPAPKKSTTFSTPVTPVAAAKKPAKPATASEDWLSTQACQQAFTLMQTHYVKSMVLKKEGNALVPWKWDEHFGSPQKDITPITLGIPSPFRIVSRTQRPYHGYVVSGEVQERFFDEWTQSQIPDHVTIFPIIIDNEMCGALLAVAAQGVNQRASLQLAEKITLRLSSELTAKPLAS